MKVNTDLRKSATKLGLTTMYVNVITVESLNSYSYQFSLNYPEACATAAVLNESGLKATVERDVQFAILDANIIDKMIDQSEEKLENAEDDWEAQHYARMVSFYTWLKAYREAVMKI